MNLLAGFSFTHFAHERIKEKKYCTKLQKIETRCSGYISEDYTTNVIFNDLCDENEIDEYF